MSDGEETSIKILGQDLKRLHETLGDQHSPPLMDAIEETEARIADLSATDLADTAIQLLIVHSGLEALSGEMDRECQERVKRLSALVSSALRLLVRDTRIDLAEYAGDWYLPNADREKPAA